MTARKCDDAPGAGGSDASPNVTKPQRGRGADSHGAEGSGHRSEGSTAEVFRTG